RLGMEPVGVGRFVSVPGQGLVPLERIFQGERELEQRTDPALAHTAVALSDAERADLGKWMRKARRAMARRDGSVERGASERIHFESSVIAPERRARIEQE